MAKKKAKRKPAKKAAKKKAGMRVKVTCPMCKSSCSMKMPKKCMSSCKCPECKKTMKADKCCILCDYGNKSCGGCK
jgi:hypothetical protein